ncbi:hypothetical protein [Siminovitchia terrae]|nr:hypothetical protein [Siminovitchia terrae]
MTVRVLFIDPKKGLKDVSIQEAPSVDDVVSKLKNMGCVVLSAEQA